MAWPLIYKYKLCFIFHLWMMEQMIYLREMMEELYMELTNDSNHQPSSY